MPVLQNPLFEVSTNAVSVAATSDAALLGADLAVKGGSGHYSYCWYGPDGSVLGIAPTLSVNTPGKYTVDISDECDCHQQVVYSVAMASVHDVADNGRLISPNPTCGPISIGGFEAVQLTALTLSGTMKAIISNGGQVLHRADLSALAPGIYIITLSDTCGNTRVAKLIKE